ncbi:unnamed protein product [Oikopleura dioica]|uniref:Uncharacterized protein n=1 Tax=Oikopleura dioica TaxID=34765 RepID=E4YJ88_OIKDI|nr:unnamed protein product [Oikopleura dioica]
MITQKDSLTISGNYYCDGMTYSSPLWLTSKVLAMFSVFPAVFHGWKDGDILWHGMKSETSDMVKFTNVKEQYHAVIRGNILLKSKMIEIGLKAIKTSENLAQLNPKSGLRFRQYLPVTPLLALGPLYSIHRMSSKFSIQNKKQKFVLIIQRGIYMYHKLI